MKSNSEPTLDLELVAARVVVEVHIAAAEDGLLMEVHKNLVDLQ